MSPRVSLAPSYQFRGWVVKKISVKSSAHRVWVHLRPDRRPVGPVLSLARFRSKNSARENEILWQNWPGHHDGGTLEDPPLPAGDAVDCSPDDKRNHEPRYIHYEQGEKTGDNPTFIAQQPF